jgi:hypothetical protein
MSARLNERKVVIRRLFSADARNLLVRRVVRSLCRSMACRFGLVPAEPAARMSSSRLELEVL